ncbi:VRR-NUC domain-containing protein [Methanobacterium sp.]|uniref:VRR-NUC domain-containing protein n=1 Tax=Methanobacterium sp. TaxID=2164 RepID=UPI0025F0AB6F|nr:VRR-NUC domain-containing protein [Methanobacterium sp.]MBI5458832.1 VRR-NUC domain-containing protein [Methanobacterium sp.]
MVIVRCVECGKEYELKEDENPENFQCECGGNLIYSNSLEVIDESIIKQENIIYCSSCGTENPNFANFCQECGEKISDIFEEYQHNKTKIIDTQIENFEDIGFGYVIFLSKVDGHTVGSEFPKYFKYRYDVNTDELLVDAINTNHLTRSTPYYNVEKAKVNDIKKILKKYGQPVSGRKKELIGRITDNLTENEIISEFPGSYYVLTDKGKDIVKENDHVTYYHYNSTNFIGLFSLEEYHDLLKNNADANLKYNVALDLLGKYGSTEREKGNWGLYRNSFLSKAKVNKDKGEYGAALDCYFKVCIIDSSGLSNNNSYSREFIDLAPGVTNIIPYIIKKTNSQLESDLNTLKNRYYKCNDDLNLPKSILSKEQSFNRLIKEIGIDVDLTSNEKKPSKLKEIKNDQINFVTFDVEKIDSGGRGKAKYLFEGSDLFVEEVAIKFYENLGYNALWSEDYYWGFLMALLFWDVIFARLNGVFNEGFPLASRFNDMPHDFFKPEFYLKRKNLINNRLNQLNNGNLEQEISKSYKRNYGKSCRPIEKWDRFTLEELMIPTKRMEKTIFLGILERLISNFAENRSGLPDLIVYNDNELFFSEVKSERDRVSDKQRLWHLFLAEEMQIKVDLFLVNHGERKIKNLKNSYS